MGLVVVLVAVAAWVVLRRDGGGGSDREAFDEALAGLASAPGLTYRSSGFGGRAQVTYQITAAGQALSEAPPVAGLGADVSMKQMLLDNKLFLRFEGDPLAGLDIPGLDEEGPLQDYVDDMMEEGLFGDHWSTSVSEYDGPIVRMGMSPVGLGIRLSSMLAATPDDDLGPGPEVNGTATLLADTPGGDLYVSRRSPHRVVRFVPQPPPGSRVEPPPELPELPDISIPDISLPPDLSLPELPELPELPDLSVPELQQQPEPTTTTTAPATAAEAPALPSVGNAVDHIDLDPMGGEEVADLYDRLRAEAETLGGAVDSILVFAEGEIGDSLAADIAAGRAFDDCGPDACHVEADASIVHCRGSEVPTELTFAMTVDGRPAGECRAVGRIPASGTGRLGCTNDSAEWAAAHGAGGVVDATVADVQAMVFTADDVEQLLADLDRHAEEAAGMPSVPDGPLFGFHQGAEIAAGPDAAAAVAAPDQAKDPELRAVLQELGIGASKWQTLVTRAGRPPRKHQPQAEVITKADAQALRALLLELVREETGQRPLDRIDPASATRVVTRALAARDRTPFLHALETLRAAYEIVRRSDQAPARVDSLADGARIFLDLGGGTIEDGGQSLDLGPLQLDPERGTRRVDQDRAYRNGRWDPTLQPRRLDVTYRSHSGDWRAVGVWPDPGTARRESSVERVEVLGNFRALLGGEATMWVPEDNGFYHLVEPLAGDDLPAAGVDPVTPPLPPTVPLTDVVPADEAEPFTHQTNATFAAAYVNGQLEGEVHESDGPQNHAEVGLDGSGDIDRAIDRAVAEATPGQAPIVDVLINRTPCSAGTCHTRTTAAAERAAAEGVVLRYVVTGTYEGNDWPNGATTSGWVKACATPAVPWWCPPSRAGPCRPTP